MWVVKLGGSLARSAALADWLRMAAEVGGGRVVVESDRVTVEARRVIVAIPPVLAAQIEFRPGLPSARAQLLQRYPAGALIKAEAIYPTPFWRS